MKTHALLLITVLASSCATPEHHSSVPGTKVWTSSELNAKKQEMQGAEVIVDAYLIHEPENYALWDNKEAQSKGDVSSCISLTYPKSASDAVRRSNRKQVRLRGTFVRDVTTDGGLYLGLCNYTGLRVVEVLR